MRGRRYIHFVDNNAAKDGLIKGLSKSVFSTELLDLFWELEVESGSFGWFERVPSPSNISDGPSRLRPDDVKRQGGVEASVPELSSTLFKLQEGPSARRGVGLRAERPMTVGRS